MNNGVNGLWTMTWTAYEQWCERLINSDVNGLWTVVWTAYEQRCEQVMNNNVNGLWIMMWTAYEQWYERFMNNDVNGLWTMMWTAYEQWCDRHEHEHMLQLIVSTPGDRQWLNSCVWTPQGDHVTTYAWFSGSGTCQLLPTILSASGSPLTSVPLANRRSFILFLVTQHSNTGNLVCFVQDNNVYKRD